jgi:predicted N-formylglutamate amidohydrolase
MPSDRNARKQIAAQKTDCYTVIAGAADAGLVLVCDHAGNAFPSGYGTLGLPEAQLKRHIAYDIGAGDHTTSGGEPRRAGGIRTICC